jgi:hypothetical protein
LQPISVIDAVLQAQDHSTVLQVRGDQAPRNFRISRFHTKQNDIRVHNTDGVSRGGYLHVIPEIAVFQQEAVPPDRFYMLGTPYQGYQIPGPCEHRAEIATDGSGAHNRYFHASPQTG